MHLTLLPILADADDAMNYSYSYHAQLGPGGILMSMIIGSLVAALFLWGVFKKAGLPPWGSLIPIYNSYLLCKAAGKPGWWLILLLIPFVNIVIYILLCLGLAKCFGKGGGFAVGLIFLPYIFLLILGYGSAQYVGNAGAYPGGYPAGGYPPATR